MLQGGESEERRLQLKKVAPGSVQTPGFVDVRLASHTPRSSIQIRSETDIYYRN